MKFLFIYFFFWNFWGISFSKFLKLFWGYIWGCIKIFLSWVSLTVSDTQYGQWQNCKCPFEHTPFTNLYNSGKNLNLRFFNLLWVKAMLGHFCDILYSSVVVQNNTQGNELDRQSVARTGPKKWTNLTQKYKVRNCIFIWQQTDGHSYCASHTWLCSNVEDEIM